jgi:putative addiction module component (TIGR02574 family)
MAGAVSLQPRVGQRGVASGSVPDIALDLRIMSQHPPARVLADALRLPAQDRLAIAAELIDSVEERPDVEWDAAWLAELDRRAEEAAANPDQLEDWGSVRTRLLTELRSK